MQEDMKKEMAEELDRRCKKEQIEMQDKFNLLLKQLEPVLSGNRPLQQLQDIL